MGSWSVGKWPSFDAHNFSQLRPNDPSAPSAYELIWFRLLFVSPIFLLIVGSTGSPLTRILFLGVFLIVVSGFVYIISRVVIYKELLHLFDEFFVYISSNDNISCTLLHFMNLFENANRNKKMPITYHPTHERTLPPPDQVISSEAKNILLRQFYQRDDEKYRLKRAAPENLAPEQECKHQRAYGASTSKPPP